MTQNINKYSLERANAYIKANKDNVVQDFRPGYHVTGEIGWINDPNGFSYFNDEYHLFYQYYPYKAQWGPMHWGHLKSKDLIQWTDLPVALAPDQDYDRDGCFSGSAIQVDDQHVLMYTGHVNPNPEDPSQIRQTQCIAIGDGQTYEKIVDNPVITAKDLAEDTSIQDFRDPKIFEQDGLYYTVIGSRTTDSKGQILLYSSGDLKEWTYKGILLRGTEDFGTVWECPDLFEIDGQSVLLMSPQFLKRDGDRYHNIHSSVYKVGKVDLTETSFEVEHVDEIDYGFDFYAPQTLIDSKGRRIMIAWMQMWDRTIPTAELGHQWAGMMTLPRVLSLKDNVLYQEPVKEIENYRGRQTSLQGSLEQSYTHAELKGNQLELNVTLKPKGATRFGLKLRKGEGTSAGSGTSVGESVGEETLLYYDVEEEKLYFDRSKSGHDTGVSPTEEGVDGVRSVPVKLDNGELNLRMFLDRSSVEVFINGGIRTMSSTVYPSPHSNGIELFADGEVEFELDQWEIEVK